MPLKVKEEDTKEIQNPTEDYSALIQVDVLPSKFLPYPEKSEIYFKSYTFGEISKMSQSKVNASKKIDMALEGIQTKGFNKDNISYFDLQYISLLRRGSTFSTSDFSIRYTCRNKEVEKEGDGEEKTERCKHENFEILPLTNFEFIDLEIPKLPINVNFSNKKVKFNVFTVGDYKFLDNIGKANDSMAILAKQTDIEKFEEAYEFIQEVTGTDLVWLKKIDVLLNHGLKPFKLECRDCKYINYIGAGEGDVIIMPFCRTEDPHGDIISFG
jgi:hypothetical protein